MPTSLPTPELQTRDLTSRELFVRASSANEEDRSFEAVVATETRAVVYDWRRGEYVEEILVAEGGEFPSSIPLLNDHNRYSGVSSVMGSASNFRMENGQWIGRGVVGRAVEGNIEREQTWRDVADGHIRAVSIGYQVREYIDIAPRQKQRVGEKEYEAGERTLRVTTSWRVHELSLTPIGADSEALIRSQRAEQAQPILRSYFAR